MSTKAIAKVLPSLTPDVERDFPNLCTRQNSIIMTIVVPADPSPEQHMAMIEASGTLSFWDQPEEDIYSDDDGEPV